LRGIVIIAGLFVFGLAATYFMESAGLDTAWTAHFYQASGAHEGWIYARDFPWGLLYDYGELPAWVLLAVALAVYVGAFWGKARPDYKRACLVIVLTIALGPGLLVNSVLKNSWGRPRPVDIAAFGGPSAYQKVWEMGRPGEGKSFTCGHCSMAFAISSAAAFYPFHPVAAIAALVAGIAYGILMGVARVAQGGHFPTDVLWSGIVVLALLAALYYLVFRIPARQTAEDET